MPLARPGLRLMMWWPIRKDTLTFASGVLIVRKKYYPTLLLQPRPWKYNSKILKHWVDVEESGKLSNSHTMKKRREETKQESGKGVTFVRHQPSAPADFGGAPVEAEHPGKEAELLGEDKPARPLEFYPETCMLCLLFYVPGPIPGNG